MVALKIIIVDDNETFRKGVAFYIATILKHNVIAIVSDGAEFLNLPNIVDADIVLMDIEMPNINGIDAIRKYLWFNRSMRSIAITSYEENIYLTELIGAGFKGCVLKKNIYTELNVALDKVMKGSIYFPQDLKVI